MKNRSHGFTLIELMIVVAVISILAAVAIPSYQDSVRKGKRAEGRAALTELLLQQERYMTQMNTYLAFDNSAGVTNPATASTTFKVYSGNTSAQSAYLLRASVCDSSIDIRDCVKVEAVPTFDDTDVGTLQLLSTGTKT